MFPDYLKSGDLPYAHMLFGLQNIEDVTPEIIAAKEKLANLLSPNDNRDVLTACGDNWWLEIGPISFDKEMVTIQQGNNLIAVIQSRKDGRLRISTYSMLDKRCLSILINASLIPHSKFGIYMRENNWEYIKDQSVLISNAYDDRVGSSYLSYWKFGLGVNYNKNIIDEWYSQRILQAISPRTAVTELGIYYIFEKMSDNHYY